MKTNSPVTAASARSWALAFVAYGLLATAAPAASALTKCPNPPCVIQVVAFALSETTSGGRATYLSNVPALVRSATGTGYLEILTGPAPWTSLVIDEIRSARPALAADSLGEALVSYFDVARRDLKFARQTSGVWSRTYVDTAGSVGQHSSVARIVGGVGIAYYDSTHGDLEYAQKIGNEAWTVQRVDSVGNVGLYPSLVANLTNGALAISYYDASRGVLRLAIGFAGGWYVSTVDSSGNVGGYTLMILRPAGYGIAYYDYSREDIKYVYYQGGAYHFEIVDSLGSVGRFCSLAGWGSSPSGEVGISYYDAGAGDLRYAQRMGSWISEIEDDEGNTGLFASCMSTASGDSLGIVYYSLGDNHIYYLSRTTPVADVAPGPRAGGSARVAWSPDRSGAGGRVRFHVPSAGSTSLSLCDVLGRRVAVLLHEARSAGDGELAWDGRDATGRRLCSGVYYLRLETANGSASVPAVIVR